MSIGLFVFSLLLLALLYLFVRYAVTIKISKMSGLKNHNL